MPTTPSRLSRFTAFLKEFAGLLTAIAAISGAITTLLLMAPKKQERPGDSEIAAVHLFNQSDATIAHVQFGCAQWGGWSGEQLSRPISPGGEFLWPKLQPGPGTYDLKAMDADGRLLDERTDVMIHGTYHWQVSGGSGNGT